MNTLELSIKEAVTATQARRQYMQHAQRDTSAIIKRREQIEGDRQASAFELLLRELMR